MKKLIAIGFTFFAFICISNSQNDKIIINKQPRTTSTSTPTNTDPYPTNNKKTDPYPGQSNTNNQAPQQQRVSHQNNQQLGHIDLGYTVSELGQTSSHNHYRITGHIYSDHNEPIFCHNRRIVIFQIDNWDSGFFNDNLQSVDGYLTEYKLNPSGNLYVFGNSTSREFAFDFKVKKGLQPRVKSEILKDWAPLQDYEQYLLLEYAMLNGAWNMDTNAEAQFDIQFSTQGNQLVMKDIFGTPVTWVKSEGNSYVRKIGDVPATPTTTQQQQQTPSTDSNSSSNYPSGGYLGNATNNSNSQNQNQPTNDQNNQSDNTYPSGGYLGNGNSNNQQGTNTTTQNVYSDAYSSVIEIVDRTTIRYRNSEGIVCLLKKM